MKAPSALTREITGAPADRRSRDRLGAVSLYHLIAFTCLSLAVFCSAASSALAQGTGFTYQGRLADGGAPANGSYDFTFTLRNAQTGPGTVAGPVTNLATAVTNGLFTVTLDFGPVFDGNARWLEIGVRTNSGDAFTTLSPRQPLTPAPYALYAPNAGAAGTVTTVPLSALPGSVLRLDTNQQLSVTGDISVSSLPIYMQGFEATAFPPANWVTGGTQPWFRTNLVRSEGQWSAASGRISDNETNYIQFTYTVPVSAVLNLKFDWKVDSEQNYDFLTFFVDGTQISSISGAQNWTTVTYPVSSGTHTFRWDYSKDISFAVGEDRGWIDNVRLVGNTGSLSAEGSLRVAGSSYLNPNVGIGTTNPMRPLQIGDAGVYGSQALLRMASRSTNGGENRIWDIGVPQTGMDLTGAGYSFIIDDTQLGTDPEFIVHWGNGRVGIGRTNPVSALDVNGTVTATAYVGDASGMTNLSAANVTGVLALAQLPGAVVTNNQSGVTLSGVFRGDGTELVNLNLNRATGDSLRVGRDWGDNLFEVYGSTWILEQAQEGFGAYFPINGGVLWQSFTCGTNGILTALQTWVYSGGQYGGGGAWSATLRVREGEGTAGAILTAQPVAGDGTFQMRTFILETPVSLTASNQYTYSLENITVSVWTRGAGNVYAGGRSSWGTSYDYWFRTYMVNQAAVPAVVVQPNTLYVGIGKANPTTALDVNGTVTATSFAGNASGLTNLDAADLTGTVADARLSTNVALLNAHQAFTGSNRFAGVATLTNTANRLAGSHSGDGSGLTNINAAHITGFSGMTVVSTLPNDSALTSNGYRAMMTVPAPPWVNGSSSEAPSARAGHTATWTGQRLLVWGGQIASSLFTASGAMYQPDADQWETISTLSAPTVRAGHTAVWTGDKLIIWGGYNGSGWLGNGGKFQPGQPTWTAVATNGAPVERSGHISVWTSSRMVVWGGRNATGLLNNGALYDPTADQWTALSLANPPEARAGAIAVWTGSRLLLWGGEGNSGALSNGAQLTFSGVIPTAWTAMSSVNAPSARRGHTAVWTGQKMLVWGGEKNGVPLGDGGAFDPAANTWVPLSLSNSPTARFQHAAVWTGEEMLILGGSTSVTELASSFAYNSLTSVWRPLSNSGGPQPRMDATAAWIGTEVLVFGGRAQGQYLSALQRLVPQPIWYFYRKL